MTLLLSSSRKEVSWKSFEANQTNTRVPILFRSVKILLTKTILLWNRRRFCFATFLFLVYSFLEKKITSYSSITVKTGCFLYGKKKRHLASFGVSASFCGMSFLVSQDCQKQPSTCTSTWRCRQLSSIVATFFRALNSGEQTRSMGYCPDCPFSYTHISAVATTFRCESGISLVTSFWLTCINILITSIVRSLRGLKLYMNILCIKIYITKQNTCSAEWNKFHFNSHS